jgi:hypothetical protein
MTAHYARLSDRTVRDYWERARKVNAAGQPVHLRANGSLGDAAWAKQQLSRATQALPNGYCELPLVQTCPHANSCLTCPMFVMTAQFLPQHHAQRRQTLQIISAAEANGHARVAEMNRQVAANLDKIITPSKPAAGTAGRRPPVRPDPLSQAAARRYELTRAKAIQALRELDRAGAPVTFAAVASAARIPRSWLYTQPDTSDQIRRLRGKQTAPAPPAPFLPASGPPTRPCAPGSPPPSPGTSGSPTRTPSSAASWPAHSANSGPPGPDQVTIRTRENRPSGRARPSKTLSTTGRRRSQPRLTPGLKITMALVVQTVLICVHSGGLRVRSP